MEKLQFGSSLDSVDTRLVKLENRYTNLESSMDIRFSSLESSNEKRFNAISESLNILLRRSNSNSKQSSFETNSEKPSSTHSKMETNFPTAKLDKGKEKETFEETFEDTPNENSKPTGKKTKNPASHTGTSTFGENNLYLPDGSINLHRAGAYPYTEILTAKEREVKQIWPEVKLRSEVPYEDFETSFKNRAFLKPEWRLIKAKDNTFVKLRLIQSSLYTSLVPYRLWPQRISSELDGDFHLVRRLIEQFNIDWLQTIEAIIKVLKNHQVLHMPVPAFARLMPFQGENYEDYSWRIRDSFFKLPLNERGTSTTRGILIENIRTYMPSVWSFLQDTQDLYSNSLNIADPTFDDQQIATTTEEAFAEKSLTCYTCGKSGHIAPHCPSKRLPHQRRTDTSNSKGQRVTIKGILFNESTKVANFLKSSSKKFYDKNNHKSYMIDTINDDTKSNSFTERLERDDDGPESAYLVAVGGGHKHHNTRPLREGYGLSHKVTRARLTLDPNKTLTIFWDYGSPACYISHSLANSANSYTTKRTNTLSGVGGKGETITNDAVISFQLATRDNNWTTPVTISGGIVDDNTFPGDICLGKSLYHKFGFYSIPNGDIMLQDFPDQPILQLSNPYSIFPKDCYSNISHQNHIFLTMPIPPPNIIVPNHRSPIFHRDTPIWAQKIVTLYAKQFPGLFDSKYRNTSKASKVTHAINTENHPPIRVSPRPYSPAHEQAIRDFLNGKVGTLIRKSKSPWASRALLTLKKTPEPMEKPVWRFCVDYRPLNKATVKNAFYEIQKAAGHKWYTFLDFKDGFWHINIAPQDIHKTAFTTPWGLYEWLVMPFGLCNSPATFQAFIEEILEPFRDHCAGLLDDICIWADTKDQLHHRNLLIMQRLTEYGILLNDAKCRFFVNKGIFLGFMISIDGIQVDPDKVSAIRERPVPQTTTAIRGFISAAGYMRFLIKDFSKLCEPLHELMVGPKNAKINLTNDAKRAWENIREAITTSPVVAMFQFSLPVIIEPDASQKYVGGALLQPHLKSSGKRFLHPVAYFSKKLTPTQQRYPSQEREMLGVVMCLQHWKTWVEGGDVTVVSDHESLKLFRSKVEQPPRMMRFINIIEHYGINIVFRQGKANVLADYLSRPQEPVLVSSETDHWKTILNKPISPKEQTYTKKPQTITRLDVLSRIDLQSIFEYLATNEPLPARLLDTWVTKHFAIHNNELYFLLHHPNVTIGEPPTKAGVITMLKIIEYETLTIEASKIHEKLGHASIGITLRELQQNFWHPNISLAANEAVRLCKTCQLMKKPDPAPLNLTPISPPQPLTRWAIDHTGPGGPNQYLLLNAIEYATGWGTTAIKITPQRPRGNGKVEQANGILKNILNRLVLDMPGTTYSTILDHAVSIYNRRIGPNGYSPHFLMFGTKPPEEQLIYPIYTREPTNEENEFFAKDLVKLHAAPLARSYVASLKCARDTVRVFTQENKALFRTFTTGDWVLRVRSRNHKNEPYYDGP
ncbi:hypothetical protein K3495_g10645 [Podosphaera aphanis]|nr:hypothetical protein K3495_g10645 [Podosphaera aphanis]